MEEQDIIIKNYQFSQIKYRYKILDLKKYLDTKYYDVLNILIFTFKCKIQGSFNIFKKMQ